MDGTLSPPVDLVRELDVTFFRRRWPRTAVVDSASIVGPGGRTLLPGGPLVIFAPVEWMGPEMARARFAIYFDRVDYGEEWYVRVRLEEGEWRVVEVKAGWAN